MRLRRQGNSNAADAAEGRETMDDRERYISLFDFDGETYEVDIQAITTKQAVELKRFLGATVAEWRELLGEADAEAMQFYFWLGLVQAGQSPGKPGDVDVPLMDSDVRPKHPVEESDDEENPTTSPEAETIL